MPKKTVKNINPMPSRDAARLGYRSDETFLNLSEVAAGSWSAAAVVLTGCRGSRDQFRAHLQRINTRRFLLVAHEGTPGKKDRTPCKWSPRSCIRRTQETTMVPSGP